MVYSQKYEGELPAVVHNMKYEGEVAGRGAKRPFEKSQLVPAQCLHQWYKVSSTRVSIIANSNAIAIGIFKN